MKSVLELQMQAAIRRDVVALAVCVGLLLLTVMAWVLG